MKLALGVLLIGNLAAMGTMHAQAGEINWVGSTALEQAKLATVIIELGINGNQCCGFFVSGDGLIVTSAAMLQGCRNVIVRDSLERRIPVSTMLGMDEAKQIAILATGHRPAAFLQLHQPVPAIGRPGIVIQISPKNAVEAVDVLHLALIAPGCMPEVGGCEAWSLASKPPLSGSLGGALISEEGVALGMCAYWGTNGGMYPQPLAAAVTAKAITTALDTAKKDMKTRPFPSLGEVTRESLNLGPDFQEASRLIALGDLTGAVFQLEKAIQKHPADSRPLDHLAGCLMSTGRLVEARSAAEKARQLDPDNHFYSSRLAEILMAQGAWSDAQNLLQSLTERAPNHAHPWEDIALLHLASGRSSEAETCARKAIALRPDFMNLWEGYRKILLSMGKIEDARLASDRLAELESLYFKLKFSSPNRR
jgi:Flp pilus assembly protein TadD